MAFVKKFLFNLALLVGVGIIVYIANPKFVTDALNAYFTILGPIAILFVIITAIPKKSGKRY